MSTPTRSFTHYISLFAEERERLKTDSIYYLNHFAGGKLALKVPGFEFRTDNISYYRNATFSVTNLTERNLPSVVSLVINGPFRDSDFKSGPVKSIAIESNTFLIP